MEYPDPSSPGKYQRDSGATHCLRRYLSKCEYLEHLAVPAGTWSCIIDLLYGSLHSADHNYYI